MSESTSKLGGYDDYDDYVTWTRLKMLPRAIAIAGNPPFEVVGYHKPRMQIDIEKDDAMVSILAAVRSNGMQISFGGRQNLDEISRRWTLNDFLVSSDEAMCNATNDRRLPSIRRWISEVLKKNSFITGNKTTNANDVDIKAEIRGYQLWNHPAAEKIVVTHPLFGLLRRERKKVIRERFSLENNDCPSDKGASWVVARAKTLLGQHPTVYEGLATKVWEQLGQSSAEVWSSLLREHDLLDLELE